jgi:hypothetical protein
MVEKSDIQDLVLCSKEGAVSTAELHETADILAADRGGADTYSLLYVLGRSQARTYEGLVAGSLEYRIDPMVARLALQILCRFWGLTDKYHEKVLTFLKGVDWDCDGDVRQIAISATGEFLTANRDCVLLDQLLRLGGPANDDEIERRIAIEAIARAVGVPLKEALNPDLSSVAWEAWADRIRECGQERFTSECT